MDGPVSDASLVIEWVWAFDSAACGSAYDDGVCSWSIRFGCPSVDGAACDSSVRGRVCLMLCCCPEV